jgi:beta-N-acetylhexosaminidase
VGQKLVVRMDGTTPSAGLLARIAAGQVGGVILYKTNFADAASLEAITTKLQAAAHHAGRPPLLVMTDQEGGAIRNLPWAPPVVDARAMGENGTSSYVLGKGERTGTALAALGVNVDLAPVADVPHTAKSFMYLERRTFSSDPTTAARLALAFSNGLRAGGVLPTVKHFPGIGRVKLNTDFNVQAVTASVEAMQSDLKPFRRAINHGAPLVMLSNATYDAWDSVNAAGWSPAIATTLLRTELGFKGVSITDSLTGTAHARGVTEKSLAVKAAIAGTDLILVTADEAGTQAVYDRLLQRATDGTIPRATLRASYDRILALKATLGG